MLNQGGVVVIPTDTVYGLAARPDFPEAVDRLYTIKGRELKKPIALLAETQIDHVKRGISPRVQLHLRTRVHVPRNHIARRTKQRTRRQRHNGGKSQRFAEQRPAPRLRRCDFSLTKPDVRILRIQLFLQSCVRHRIEHLVHDLMDAVQCCFSDGSRVTYPIVKNTNPKATKTVYPIICQIVNTIHAYPGFSGIIYPESLRDP